MAPNPPGSSAERPYHAAAAAANGKAIVAGKPPGPARRDTGHTRERALQDPGLKDYVCFRFCLVCPVCKAAIFPFSFSFPPPAVVLLLLPFLPGFGCGDIAHPQGRATADRVPGVGLGLLCCARMLALYPLFNTATRAWQIHMGRG